MPKPNKKIIWVMPDNYIMAKQPDGREKFMFGWTDALVTWGDLCGEPPVPEHGDYKEP